MTRNLQRRKDRKKQNIMQAAYDCFIANGIHKTTIDEIVKKADIAKGTFYLYFKDKTELSRQIFIELSKDIIINAYHRALHSGCEDYLDLVICFVDNIIEYFKSNKLVLKLIERNFSWPLIESKLSEEQEDETLQQMQKTLFSNPYQPNLSREQTFQYLFSIIALCGSVGYSSIINGEPDDIDTVKPVLYEMIRKILR